MKLCELKLTEASKEKAISAEDLLASIKDGIFAKDGSHLKIDGNFLCSDKNLTSLAGAPKIISGEFRCVRNNLTSLEGGPQEVGGNYSCVGSKLKSLVGAPTNIGGDFNCGFNHLTSLVGGPNEVGGDFICSNNDIDTLKGAPKSIGGDFWCDRNRHLIAILSLLKIKGLKKVHYDNMKVEKIINKYLPTGDMLDCVDELQDAGLEEYTEI